MRGVLLVFSVGCTIDLRDDEPYSYTEGDSGGGDLEAGQPCALTAECAGPLRCDGRVCTGGCIDDGECAGNFACGVPGSGHTDGDGCYQRCDDNDDCKAGTLCDDAGACNGN